MSGPAAIAPPEILLESQAEACWVAVYPGAEAQLRETLGRGPAPQTGVVTQRAVGQYNHIEFPEPLEVRIPMGNILIL